MKELNGIMYCETHEDVAIEGYDWSEVCHEAWSEDPHGEGNVLYPCKLVPIFVNEDEHVEPDQADPHGMPRPVDLDELDVSEALDLVLGPES